MQLDHIRAEIERMRTQVSRQRREILQLQRAGRNSLPAEALLARMRLAEGMSVSRLAANKGTSVETLEDFYGKKRMRDPQMATELTKNRRSGRTT